MFDEDLPKPKCDNGLPRSLDDMSISDLEEYINDLEAEISRVRSDIDRKKASSQAADSFFK